MALQIFTSQPGLSTRCQSDLYAVNPSSLKKAGISIGSNCNPCIIPVIENANLCACHDFPYGTAFCFPLPQLEYTFSSTQVVGTSPCAATYGPGTPMPLSAYTIYMVYGWEGYTGICGSCGWSNLSGWLGIPAGPTTPNLLWNSVSSTCYGETFGVSATISTNLLQIYLYQLGVMTPFYLAEYILLGNQSAVCGQKTLKFGFLSGSILGPGFPGFSGVTGWPDEVTCTMQYGTLWNPGATCVFAVPTC